MHDVWPQASAKSIELVLNPAVDFEDTWMLGDGEILVRALVNLLSNALRYSSNGASVEILLRVDADHLILAVQDSGQGMNSAQLQQLNDVANQRANLRRVMHDYSSDERVAPVDAAGSLGVGLHMVCAVVKQHRGQISFEAHEPRGTRVIITLPRAPAVT